MASGGLSALAITAVGLGLIHALLGPDHWLPFVALARIRRWSLGRTVAVTLACGLGHVAASVALAILVLSLGWAVGAAVTVDLARGAAAGWLLLGFGVAYLAWGVRQGLRDRPHSHWHSHRDGRVHRHPHGHREEHAHVHDQAAARVAPWVVFAALVLGPCEALIPLLTVAGAGGGWEAFAVVASVFTAATLAAMTLAVTVGVATLAWLPLDRFERWSHAMAGGALTVCGVALRLGL